MYLASSPSIHPELQEGSPWLREAVSLSDSMMNSGIDPGLALAVAASVPVLLRVLKMVNEATSVFVADWREGNTIKRERERMEMRREFEDDWHPHDRPPP